MTFRRVFLSALSATETILQSVNNQTNPRRGSRARTPAGSTLGVCLNITEYNVLPLFGRLKWLDVLVFSDEDEKPLAPSHSSFTVLILVGRKKNPQCCALRVGGNDEFALAHFKVS